MWLLILFLQIKIIIHNIQIIVQIIIDLIIETSKIFIRYLLRVIKVISFAGIDVTHMPFCIPYGPYTLVTSSSCVIISNHWFSEQRKKDLQHSSISSKKINISCLILDF